MLKQIGLLNPTQISVVFLAEEYGLGGGGREEWEEYKNIVTEIYTLILNEGAQRPTHFLFYRQIIN